MIVYRFLRVLARIALRWFYREIEVVGAERLPLRGPVLLAGNHPNALVDALVIGCTVHSPVTLTAKATLLDHPVTRALVRSVGIVPLRRASDEAGRARGGTALDPSRNAGAFDAVLDTLERGGVVLVFPEGKSHSDPGLAPLKTGLARMAIMARDTRKLGPVPIIPVGLTFEHKSKPRTRVVVHVGHRILPEPAGSASSDDVAELTRRVEHGLRAVTLNFRSQDEAEETLAVSGILAGVLDEVDDDIRSLDSPDPPLADTFRVVRRVEAASEHLAQLNSAVAARASHFLTRLRAFEETTHRYGVALNDVTMDMSPRPAAQFVLRETVLAIFGGPLALWGRVNHWVPLRLARWLAARASRTPDEPAMRTIVTGAVLVLAFYVIQMALVAWLAGWWVAALYTASLPLSATWDLEYTDRRQRALKRTRTHMLFRRNPPLHQQLLGELSWLRNEAAALDATVGAAASPGGPDYTGSGESTGRVSAGGRPAGGR